MPNDEQFGYLSTQAMADFLSTHAVPPLDGVLYPSIQGGEAKLNAVLFHKAAQVQLSDATKGKISASLSWWSDEEEVIDYTVWEEVNDGSVDTTATKVDSPLHDQERATDQRVPTLRIDTSSLQVHHVKGIRFDTDPYPVTRHRIQRSPSGSENVPDLDSLEFDRAVELGVGSCCLPLKATLILPCRNLLDMELINLLFRC